MKIRYEIDPHNRLVLKSGKPSPLKTYRAVLDGTFKIDRNNYLIYHIKKPSPVRSRTSNGASPVFLDKRLPQQIKLKGSWSLAKNYNLIYTLDKWQNQVYGNRLILKSGFMNAAEDKLIFALKKTEGRRKERIYILAISGSWHADKFNRLTFLVEREPLGHKPIALKAGWKVNKNNEIIYRYCKEGMIRSVTFKGRWDIIRKHRLFYSLDKSKDSTFEFRVGTASYDKRGNLRYQIGIGSSYRKRLKARLVTLFGKWKIDDKTGFIFEMSYGKNKIHSITFGTSIKLNKDYTLEVDLKDRKNRPLGIKFTLSRTFFKNQAKAFISLIKERSKLTVIAGTGFLF